MPEPEIIGKPKQPIKGSPKPDNVNIVPPINVLAGPSQMGAGMNLMIFGLGNDNVLYAYNMSTKKWYDQL